jgi:hypothetical protein
MAMTKIEIIEKQISSLPPEELAQLRRWFVEFDAASWDREIEADVASGSLDALAEKALRAHAAGRSRDL